MVSADREQARIMSRSKQVMQSPTGHAKNDGDRGSPEVLDEVKVN